MTAVVPASPPAAEQSPTFYQLDKQMERIGRDWAIVYRGPLNYRCIVCGCATRLMVAFSPRAALPICGSCRGY
jgi:hypothetical protein